MIVKGRSIESHEDIENDAQYLVVRAPWDRFEASTDVTIEYGKEILEEFDDEDPEEVAAGLRYLNESLKGNDEDYIEITKLVVQ